MTTELQRAMARYEDARISYQRTMLASLQGDAGGEAIRQALRRVQSATADLRRLRGAQAPHRAARPARARAGQCRAATPGFAFFRRLLSAG